MIRVFNSTNKPIRVKFEKGDTVVILDSYNTAEALQGSHYLKPAEFVEFYGYRTKTDIWGR